MIWPPEHDYRRRAFLEDFLARARVRPRALPRALLLPRARAFETFFRARFLPPVPAFFRVAGLR